MTTETFRHKCTLRTLLSTPEILKPHTDPDLHTDRVMAAIKWALELIDPVLTVYPSNRREHRISLHGLLCDATLDQEAKEAICWALHQTQEPAPPPGGWPMEFQSPDGAIRFIEQALDHGMSPSASAMISALEWALPILRRAANLTHRMNREEPIGSDGKPGLSTAAMLATLEAAKEAASLREAGAEIPCMPTEAKRIRISLEWALLILRSEPERFLIPLEQQGPSGEATSRSRIETLFSLADWLEKPTGLSPKYAASAIRWILSKIPDPELTENQAWTAALAALTKRELRFWREAGEVSGNVTRRAASRAIRGLEQILKTIPAANLRDS